MLGLTNPLFNLREIAKNLILLEDHLAHTRKRCPDCIRKHCLTVEALADEAVTLDTDGEYLETAETLSLSAREWAKRLCQNSGIRELTQEVRQVRKTLMPLVFDPRCRVAARYTLRAVCPGHPAG